MSVLQPCINVCKHSRCRRASTEEVAEGREVAEGVTSGNRARTGAAGSTARKLKHILTHYKKEEPWHTVAMVTCMLTLAYLKDLRGGCSWKSGGRLPTQSKEERGRTSLPLSAPSCSLPTPNELPTTHKHTHRRTAFNFSREHQCMFS